MAAYRHSTAQVMEARAIMDERDDVSLLMAIAQERDQQAFTEKLEVFIAEHLPQTRIVRLRAHEPDVYKSSLLNK